jgi:hypothetical protein
MAKLAPSAPPDAISVYNEHVAVISEIKRSQWQITNYVILLFAGMLALRADIRAAIPADLRSWVAIFGPLVIWFSAAWILFQQHLGLTRRRQRIFDAQISLKPRKKYTASGADRPIKRPASDCLPWC